MRWGEVAVTDGAHGDHDKVVCLKEGELSFYVDAKEVMKKTNPEGEREGEGEEGERERERDKHTTLWLQ